VTPPLSDTAARLKAAAKGGRVAHTGFLEPDEAAALARELRAAGVGVALSGGVTGARRRVVTAFPDHIPSADTPLAAVYVAGPLSADDLLAALTAAGVASSHVGDTLPHQDGWSVVLVKDAKEVALGLRDVAGRPVTPQEVPLARLEHGGRRVVQVIVPSLRVDVLGAKAFRVSRSYFSKGVAGGQVSVNGKAASKSSSAEPGDEVNAAGLGRFTVVQVQGETRRGNLKVLLEVEQV
jgi:RNA-binding protein YlmH